MSELRRFSVARNMLITALLAATIADARAAVPVWARLLHWMSGDSDRTKNSFMRMAPRGRAR